MSAVREQQTEELYAEHNIKDDMVIGPVVMQAVTYIMEEICEPLPKKPRLDTQDKTTEPDNAAKQTRTETNANLVTETHPALHAKTSELSQNNNSNDCNGSIIKLKTEAMSTVKEGLTEDGSIIKLETEAMSTVKEGLTEDGSIIKLETEAMSAVREGLTEDGFSIIKLETEAMSAVKEGLTEDGSIIKLETEAMSAVREGLTEGGFSIIKLETEAMSAVKEGLTEDGSIIKLETEVMSAVREGLTEELYADHEIKDEMVIGPVVLQAVTYIMEENGESLPNKLTLDGQDKNTEPDNTAKRTRTETNTEEITPKDCNENTEPSGTKAMENIKNKIPTKTSKPRNNTNSKNNKNIRNDKGNKRTQNIFQCIVFAKEYNKKPNLEKHIGSHEETKRDIYFICKECTYQSVTRCSFERHMKLHDTNRRFVCDVCGYRYMENASLQRHFRNVHSGEKIHKCGICDYKTNSICDLNRHLRIHSGEKRYSCSFCEYKCNDKSYLKKHSRIHTGEKPYSCSECNYKCSDKRHLYQHIRRHITETHPASHAKTSELSQNNNSNDCHGSIIKLETEVMSAVREGLTEELYADHEIKDEMVIGPVVLQAVTYMMEENGESLPNKLSLDTQDKNTEPDNTAKRTRTETNTEEITPKDCNENTEPSDTKTMENVKNKTPTKTSKPCNNTQKNIRNDNSNKRTKNIFQRNVLAKEYNKKPDLGKNIGSHDETKRGIYFICKECTYQTVTRCSLERHLNLHDKNRRFVCDVCGYRYTANWSLQKHLGNVHSGEKTHRCGICDYKTNDINCFNRHLRIHSGEKRYSCPFCEYKCNDKSYLKRHSRVHIGEKPYSCSDCNYKSNEKSNLKLHIRKHSECLPNKLKLDTQDKNTEPDNTAKQTRTETNTEEMTTKDCNENTEPSGTKPMENIKNKIPTKSSKPCNNTQKNIRNDNSNKSTQNIFQCNDCAEQYEKKSDLVQHIESHDKTERDIHNIYFKCKECTYQSVFLSSFERHLKLHDKNRLFVCDLCGYRYTGNAYLQRHLKNIHSGEKIHRCGICDFKTNNISDLNTHLRIHSGEKPYSCSQCEYKCNQKSILKAHSRIHTGEKLYSCSKCEYKCSQRNNLITHSRIHTGEKPYSCSECNYKCNRSSSLKKHLRTHSK